MNAKSSFFFIGIVLILAACGPSSEEIATMTASAWTPTPLPTSTPTSTPTPVPFDLTVTVTDADGNPIAGANILYGGTDIPIATDETGQAAFSHLPDSEGSVDISAQGYLPSNQSFSLSPGPNEQIIALEVDPNGLLPAVACGLTESLLYIEDFQDGEAQGWPPIDLHANGWNISEFPDQLGNLTASNNSPDHLGAVLEEMSFTDAVWRVGFFVNGRKAISFNWLQNYGIQIDGDQLDDVRYQIVVDTNGMEIRRLTLPVLNIGVSRGAGAKAGEWHKIELSAYQGDIQVWLDGKRLTSYVDPKPLPGGTIGLELIPFDNALADTVIYFDNISVCSLTAPFETMYAVP